MLEAMIALALLFIAVLGTGAIAAASIHANQSAQDRTRAANLAERFAAMLEIEAMAWNDTPWNAAADTDSAGDYIPLLSRAPAAATGTSGWAEATSQLPTGVTAYDLDLNEVSPTAATARFCVHYNLTWLVQHDAILADINVYWLRRMSDDPGSLHAADCGDAGSAAFTNVFDVMNSVDSYSRPVVLRRNSGGADPS